MNIILSKIPQLEYYPIEVEKQTIFVFWCGGDLYKVNRKINDKLVSYDCSRNELSNLIDLKISFKNLTKS